MVPGQRGCLPSSAWTAFIYRWKHPRKTLVATRITCRHAGMIFIPTRLRHIGTENCKKILSRLQERLTGHVDIRTHCRAQRIMVKDTA